MLNSKQDHLQDWAPLHVISLRDTFLADHCPFNLGPRSFHALFPGSLRGLQDVWEFVCHLLRTFQTRLYNTFPQNVTHFNQKETNKIYYIFHMVKWQLSGPFNAN